jgi:MFS family permease
VLVAFVSHLTQSPFLLGLIVPIRDGAWWLPQLWVSGYLQSKPNKLAIYRRTSVLRIAAWFCIALSINLVHDPVLLLPLFFIVYVISSISNGIAGLPFLEVVAKTIPPQRRGEFFAWRMGLGGLGAIAASLLVRWAIDPGSFLKYPYNFGLLAFLYFIGASVSLLIFNRVDEKDDHQTQPVLSLKSQIIKGIKVAKSDFNYRDYMIMQSALIISGAGIPFFAIYVQRSFNVPPNLIGVYLFTLATSSFVANYFFGRLSRFMGYRKVMLMAAVAGIIMYILVILLTLISEISIIPTLWASYWLIPVFIFSGFRSTGIGVAGNSLLIELSPVSDRSLYLGFTNSILGLVLLSTCVLGLVVEVLGFEIIFIICLFFNLISLYAIYVLIRRKLVIGS